MKQKTAQRLTKLVKPCVFYQETEGAKRDYVLCQFDHSRRKRCGTWKCPHFRPTLRYRIAQRFGMVR